MFSLYGCGTVKCYKYEIMSLNNIKKRHTELNYWGKDTDVNVFTTVLTLPSFLKLSGSHSPRINVTVLTSSTCIFCYIPVNMCAQELYTSTEQGTINVWWYISTYLPRDVWCILSQWVRRVEHVTVTEARLRFFRDYLFFQPLTRNNKIRG